MEPGHGRLPGFHTRTDLPDGPIRCARGGTGLSPAPRRSGGCGSTQGAQDGKEVVMGISGGMRRNAIKNRERKGGAKEPF